MGNTKYDEFNRKDELLSYVSGRKKLLETLIKDKTVSLEKAPAGVLKAVDKMTFFQYFQRTDPKDANGVYITRENLSLARRLAQKEYDRVILREAQKELVLISRYADHLSSDPIMCVYERFSRAKRVLIEPVCTDDDEFIQEWRTEEYTPLDHSFHVGTIRHPISL